jgi:[protein-PII] uridylyltransferase
LRDFHPSRRRIIKTSIDLAPREQITRLHEDLAQRFWANEAIDVLIHDLAAGVDRTIRALFDAQFPTSVGVALYAVGGYGRSELHPGSDIDLLMVVDKPKKHQRAIELFLQSVFDLNLEVGHAVRDLKACRQESKNDITVMTAMLERRLLCGDSAMVARLDKKMQNKRLWPTARFFHAKREEQLDRHRHYDNIEYNLEPNVKTSPGGLRDIHTTLWVCNRHFGTTDPLKLVELGVLTELEAKWLIEGRRFIWWVRFGLHLLAGRKEDQLQFAYQRELAQKFGYVDTDAKLGVEGFMHEYYRHVLTLREVNDIFLQHFEETILVKKQAKVVPINDRFQLINGNIEIQSEHIFREAPSSLLELFVVMANRNDIDGVRVNTIRAIRDNLDLIDDGFRENPEHAALFLELLKAPYTVVTQLTRMRRYGVLGRYLPEFGHIVGQMQHDLFHIYTVDAHTMAVIRNMRRFRYRVSEGKFPIAYHCVRTVPKVELLYIAGLFHDIGKGRGGDHSVLGAIDAEAFCQRHSMNEADTEMISWLVKKHLYMSTVSQRQDIHDPEVVHNFATEVKSQMRLDYLYALTVADINATNPSLWNSWRATLLRQLYTETRRALRRGLESPADKATTIAACQERALEKLITQRGQEFGSPVEDLWQTLGDDFFLRHTPPQVAKLTKRLLDHSKASPFVTILDHYGELNGGGVSQIYVYTRDIPKLFARTVVTLAGLDLSVVDAVVHTDASQMCFDTYTVLTQKGEPLPTDVALRERLIDRLKREITQEEVGASFQPQLSKRRLPRRLRELPHPTKVSIKPTAGGLASYITVLASDRPGLLATIAGIFVELDLQIQSAKIATLGERVEDTFVVTDQNDRAVVEGEASYTLKETIRQHIDVALHQTSLKAG